MFHVPFDRFDEIGNQIVTTSELDVDLCEGIAHAVTFVDQSVVDSDCPEDNDGDDAEEDQK